MKGNCELCNSLQKEVQRITTGYHLLNYILRLGVYVTLFKTQIVHVATLIKRRDHPINRQHSRSLLTPKKPLCVRQSQMKLHTLFKIKTLKTIPCTAAHSVPILVRQIRECPPLPAKFLTLCDVPNDIVYPTEYHKIDPAAKFIRVCTRRGFQEL